MSSTYAATVYFLMGIFGGPLEGVSSLPNELVWEMVEDIKVWSKEMQLYDLDNSTYETGDAYFWNKDNATEDLVKLYQIYHQLKDAERVEQFHPKFIMPTDQIRALIDFNESHVKYLKIRADWEVDRLDIIWPAINYCERQKEIWNNILALNYDYVPVHRKREIYQELKLMLGDEFDKPERPDYVSSWTFRNK